MFSGRSVSAYGAGFKRKQILRKVLLATVLIIILALLPVIYIKFRERGGNERRELRELFEAGSFEAAYTRSGELLGEKPLDTFILSIHGFSACQLAIAQINSINTLSYVDDCIWSLRKALLFRESSSDGRIYYVLGKAYYYKGSGYADLAVLYLEKARTALYKAADIPEYLGLAYAAIGDYRSSVAAFTMALGEMSGAETGFDPSDVLLLSIARSYYALDEYESARAYLIRCLEISRDSRNITTARMLLGSILAKIGDIAGAEAEYNKILEENSENAEAHFQLGELYFLAGETIRARAEWRRALRINPAHGEARSRLN